MRNKILGILVCMLLIATALPVFGMEDNIENLNNINTSFNEHKKNIGKLSDNKFGSYIFPLGFLYEGFLFGYVNITTYGKTKCLYMDLGSFLYSVMVIIANKDHPDEIVAELYCQTLLGTIKRTYTGFFGLNIIVFSGTMGIETPEDDDGGNIKGNAFLFRIPKFE